MENPIEGSIPSPLTKHFKRLRIMITREGLKKKYKNGSDFTSDLSKRTIQILEEIEVVLDENAEEDLFDDISVIDYFSMMSLKDKINELISENA